MHFTINWASPIVGIKFTIFALFCFVLEGNFQVQATRGLVLGLYSEGRFNGEFFVLRVWGLIFGGVYTWRGLFSEFYGNQLVDGKGKHVGSAVVH